MDKTASNQALALSGIMHCTWLVRQLAHEGRIDETQLDCALRPVFVLDPESVASVYAGSSCRHNALTVLKTQLGAGGPTGRDMETTRYTATLMHLERKLAARDDLLQALREGIEAATQQLQHFPVTHENVIARLADLYAQTVSTLRPKVMVHGDARFLEEPRTANRVRALLLAGIRSTVLWRQCGGSRLKLIFGRGRLLNAAGGLDAG